MVRRQPDGQMIIEEFAQPRDHVVNRGVDQCPGMSAQSLSQVRLVDVPGDHALEPPPRFLTSDI